MTKRIIAFACLVSAFCLCTMAAKVEKKCTVKVGDETREYILYVPNNVKSNAPLVFSLHGTSNSMNDKHPFSTGTADQHGCIVVYPQGKSLYFPVFGGNATGWHSTGETSEDIDFFKAIIDEVAKDYSIDRNRVYCCGFSNGGMMTYTVANVASDVFAAFASISGFPLNEFHLHTTSARPYPFLHIHGKADDFVKYSLVPIVRDNTIARIGANPAPKVKEVAGKYRKSVYEATEGSFPYVYYEIDGMGHNAWTDRTEDGNSSETIWKFLSQYRLDDERDETLKWRPNVDLEGWSPKEHGWMVNKSTYVLYFGKEVKTDANQNVYNSLQFENGKYKMTFDAEDCTGKEVTVKLMNNATKKAPLNQKVKLEEKNTLIFEVNDGWGEYAFAVTRASGETINLKHLEVHAISDEEYEQVITSIKSTKGSDSKNGKWMENGAVVIMKNGTKYNVAGSIIK